jgi:hypothetical protein
LLNVQSCVFLSSPQIFSPSTPKDLHADPARCGDLIWNKLWGERRVSHDNVVFTGLCEHSLCEVGREIFFHGELAHHTLRTSAFIQIIGKENLHLGFSDVCRVGSDGVH